MHVSEKYINAYKKAMEARASKKKKRGKNLSPRNRKARRKSSLPPINSRASGMEELPKVGKPINISYKKKVEATKQKEEKRKKPN
jgi:hypothetical protein